MSIKKTSKKIQNRQKPIEYDIHLNYVCKQCGQKHWLSINEASTKKFKVVCACGHIFGVKRVTGFKLIFHKKTTPPIKQIEQEQKPIDMKPKVEIIPNELLDQIVPTLITYGFTKKEAIDMSKTSYSKCPQNDAIGLVKQILESLRSQNVN
jgi:DNA-directed RNA polymerase subunit RPC12/RpoP